MKDNYIDAITQIEAPDENAMQEAARRWHSICKPLDSLGVLEELVVRLAGIQRTENVSISNRCAMIVCADNGVVEEGISQSGMEVSSSVALEIASGKSNINLMAKAAGADTFVADVGLCSDVRHERLINKKIAYGTANILNGAAMTKEESAKAIQTGIELVGLLKQRRYQIVVTGEMGIGNTTTSSAMASVLLKLPVETVTGRGAGLSSEGLAHKIEIIKRAIEQNQPDVDDAADILTKLGGFDIAAMAGIFLGGAIFKMPIVIDGFISSVAALVAKRICPLSCGYMLASHVSDEPAGELLLKELGLKPIIHANMRLGEGTGGVCILPLLDIALAEYHNAHRFAETDIDQYEKLL